MSIEEQSGNIKAGATGRTKASLTKLDGALVGAAFLIALWGFVLGEKIEANDGFGMDGSTYGEWAANFDESVILGGLDDYAVQRVLPSAVVHYSLRLLSADLTETNVIRGFGALNIALITVSALFWSLIANALDIGPRGRVFGFVCLFINYAILKFASYYPVLTDVPCFAISLGMLYCYLTSKRLGLFALTAAGSIVWPTLFYEGALFLLFPRRADDVPAAPAPNKLNWIPAWLIAAAASIYMTWLIFYTDIRLAGSTETPPYAAVSIAFCFIYLLFGSCMLLDSHRLFQLGAAIKRAMNPSFLLSLLFLLGINRSLAALSAGASVNSLGFSSLGFGWAATEAALAGILKPLIFFVAHVIYFGPFIILAAFWFRPLCRSIHEQGLGLTLCVLVGFVMSIHSESRKIINFVPLIVPFVAKLSDRTDWRPYHYWLFGFISIVFSKVWLSIGGAPITFDPSNYPDQLYYMSHGPYMANETYVIQGIASALVTVLLFSCYWRRRGAISSNVTNLGCAARLDDTVTVRS